MNDPGERQSDDPVETKAENEMKLEEASKETPASSFVTEPGRTNAMTQPEVDDAMRSMPAGGKPRGAFYAMTFYNFRLFFYGQTVSVAGSWMQIVAQQWLVWRLTHNKAWLGVVSGANAIPFVLFSIWGGQIADKYPRRTTLVITQIAAMVLAFGLAALASGRFTVPMAWEIAIISGLSGIVNAFTMPAQQAFVTDMVDERAALANAIALNSLRFNLARILGPMFAGIVLVKFGEAACFFINGLSFIAVIISLMMMKLPPFVASIKETSQWEGFGYLRTHGDALRTVLLVASASMFAWSCSTLYPAFADRYGVGETGFSRMMSANGVGAMLAGLALAWIGDRVKREALIFGGGGVFCIGLIALSYTFSYSLSLAILVLTGFAMIIFGISSNTKVQTEAPDALRGRIMAIYSLVFNGLMPAGSLIIGFLAQRMDIHIAVRIHACLFGACLIGAMLSKRRAD